jgi:hypothetical protein
MQTFRGGENIDIAGIAVDFAMAALTLALMVKAVQKVAEEVKIRSFR